jgi:16S rRNA (adenine1518-N6/adenine1519-N6)-dimethyltransferase
MNKDIIESINSLPSIASTIKEYNLYAKKKLSQNFILDINLTNKIVNLSKTIRNNTIIEIGAGPGSLTRSMLLNGAKKIIIIEKDKRFIEALNRLNKASGNKLIIENKDALKVSLSYIVDKYNINEAEIIANLPYSIATKLLLNWIPCHKNINKMTLMFQREVAERIVATPGSKKYGRLSIMLGLMTNSKIIMNIPASAFTPKPKINSSIIQVLPKPIDKLLNKNVLENITKTLFNQRRKQIKSTLSKFGDPVRICNLLDINPSIRPENLTLQKYKELTYVLSNYQNL